MPENVTGGLSHWLPDEFCGVTLVADKEFPGVCRWAKAYIDEEHVKRWLPDKGALVAIRVGPIGVQNVQLAQGP